MQHAVRKTSVSPVNAPQANPARRGAKAKNAAVVDPVNLLKKDHSKVKALFKAFEQATQAEEKHKIAAEAIAELEVHAAVEEEIFYPAMRKCAEKDLLAEAAEEHHVAKVLMAELAVMAAQPKPNDVQFAAKFTVLAESVRHHIKEEETQLLPETKKLTLDREALGRKMLARKTALFETPPPESAEAEMVALAVTARKERML